MTCKKCEEYKKDLEKYKRQYEMARTGLTAKDRNILIELICNEQLKHFIPKLGNNGMPEEYNILEQLKAKIRVI